MFYVHFNVTLLKYPMKVSIFNVDGLKVKSNKKQQQHIMLKEPEVEIHHF